MRSASQAGILNPGAAPAHFELRRHPPAADLADLVERHWIVRWDLRGREPHLQETLPHPCVNLVLQAGCSAVHGCGTRKFAIVLADAGQVFGVKFRPGGFFPFVRAPVAQFTDRSTPVAALFGEAAAALEPEVLATTDDRAQIDLVETFLRAQLHGPVADEVARVVGVVQQALERREITSVEALGAQVGLTPRTLQRLFKKYVGVGPKWTIRRYRLHEAAERLADGAPVDWAAMAQELGYFDQAHFIRDFKQQIGRSPGEYAAECAAHPRTVTPAPASTADCDSDPTRPAAR